MHTHVVPVHDFLNHFNVVSPWTTPANSCCPWTTSAISCCPWTMSANSCCPWTMSAISCCPWTTSVFCIVFVVYVCCFNITIDHVCYFNDIRGSRLLFSISRCQTVTTERRGSALKPQPTVDNKFQRSKHDGSQAPGGSEQPAYKRVGQGHNPGSTHGDKPRYRSSSSKTDVDYKGNQRKAILKESKKEKYGKPVYRPRTRPTRPTRPTAEKTTTATPEKTTYIPEKTTTHEPEKTTPGRKSSLG